MEQLLNELLKLSELHELVQAVSTKGCPASVTGLSPVVRAQAAAALAQATGRPLLMLCAD